MSESRIEATIELTKEFNRIGRKKIRGIFPGIAESTITAYLKGKRSPPAWQVPAFLAYMRQHEGIASEIGDDTGPEAKHMPRNPLTEEEKAIAEEKLLEKRVLTEWGCWNYGDGTTGGYNYPQVNVGERVVVAHRAAYEIWKGTIPQLLVCHRCDNSRCFNPEHLFLGTYEDNAMDRIQKKQEGKHPGWQHMPPAKYELVLRPTPHAHEES